MENKGRAERSASLFRNRWQYSMNLRLMLRALTRFGVYGILQEIASLCPVPTDVKIFFNPHRFRHDRATLLLDGGMKESTLADYLGHSSTNYISNYTKPDRKARVEMIREAERKGQEHE